MEKQQLIIKNSKTYKGSKFRLNYKNDNIFYSNYVLNKDLEIGKPYNIVVEGINMMHYGTCNV